MQLEGSVLNTAAVARQYHMRENQSEAKIQYQKVGSSSVSERLLRIGEFDEAFTKAHAYLEQRYEREVVIANA